MIVAGLLLIAVGALDALRAALPARRHWAAPVAVIAVLIVFAAVADAWAAGAIAVAGALAWMLTVPATRSGRAGFWPAVVLAGVVAAALAIVPRSTGGVLGAVWSVNSPIGPISLDESVMVLGVVLFLLESANAVVRVALAQEGVPAPAEEPGEARFEDEPAASGDLEVAAPPAEQDAADDASPPHVAPADSVLKGGRLIGPIERLIVFSLTLAAAYPLLAAFIAAKGIVRFPEISRDSAVGNRAEYFLIGSLVSWLQGLAGAFAVWFALAS